MMLTLPVLTQLKVDREAHSYDQLGGSFLISYGWGRALYGCKALIPYYFYYLVFNFYDFL